jgi:type VI secretion system VasD/TssJ family lipoprotein
MFRYHLKLHLHHIKSMCALSVLIFVTSCASVTELTVPDDGWVFEERAIKINIVAPSDLNARSGRPHALTLGVFQLSDPNTFGALTQENSGAIELLRKGRIDDTIVDFRRITVQPGETLTEVLGRAEKAKFIGIIAGYFDLSVSQDVHIYKVPCMASGRGLVEKLLASLALIADESKAAPDKIDIGINLGRARVKKYELNNETKLSSFCAG